MHRWAAHAIVIAVMLHCSRLSHRQLQVAARVQLGHRRAAAGADAAIVVYRLSAALGPAFALGGHGRLEHGRGHAASGREGPGHSLLPQGMAGSLDPKTILLGASAVGEETLNRFYVLHCVAVPLFAGVLMAIHFWRVRKDGISGPL